MNDLSAAVVHDVKNQLAELAMRLEKRGDAQQEMAIAINAARRLSEMLLIYRQDTNTLSVNSDTVNPGDFLAILAAEYRELFPQIAIEINPDKAPQFVFFDDALVRMALSNALHNACRYAKSRVVLSAYEKDKMVVLEVSDDGHGYSESMMAEAGAEPSAVSGIGTGLGLYLARRIAELHQLDGRPGRIELGNAGGAVFRMMLP